MTRRRRPQATRSTAPSTKGSDLLLYSCPRLSAWLTVNACTTLRTSAGRRLREHRYDRRDLEPQPREVRPCTGCEGVLALRAKGLTPAPRRVATD